MKRSKGAKGVTANDYQASSSSSSSSSGSSSSSSSRSSSPTESDFKKKDIEN